MTSVADKIREIIAEQAVLEVEDVKDASTPDDLGIDSLGLVETVFAIEEAFDISNVAAIIKAVEGLIADQKG